MSKQFYWLWDKESKIVTHHKVEATYRAGHHHIPRTALRVEPLPYKDGYQVIVVVEGDKPVDTEYLEDYRGRTIFNKAICNEFKEVTELGPMPDGWTNKVPKTRFDEWVTNNWVTNLQAQYDAEYAQVGAKRKSLYSSQVDPLISESQMKRLMGHELEAHELEQQAITKRAEIQSEHPWPTPPELSSEV